MEAWDVVVIGGGSAALRAAIAASDAAATVTVLSPHAPGSSTDGGAGGGISASISETDPSAHMADTLRVGADLCESDVVAASTAAAATHLAEIERWGLNLRRDHNGLPQLGQLPGQGQSRTASTGDSTARELLAILEEQCIKRAIPRRGDIEVLDLVMTESGARGLIAMDVQSGVIFGIQAKAIILAGAGYESAWRGDGVGMGCSASLAFRSGIALADLEFTHVHPLTVAHTDIALPLDLLGAGGVVNGPAGPLSSDDGPEGLSRAILEAGGASLDLTGIARGDQAWVGDVADLMRSRCGIDIGNESIPLSPAIATTLGGIPTDASGAVVESDWGTVVPGLYAAGDAACSGLHGAALNSGDRLLGALVGGATAGATAAAHAGATNHSGSSAIAEALSEAYHVHDAVLQNAGGSGTSAGALLASLAATMRAYMGPTRDAGGLETASAEIEALRNSPFAISDGGSVMNTELVSMRRTQGLLAIAEAAVASAAARTESRGSHVRSDHPDTDAGQTHHSLASASGEIGSLSLRN